MTDSRMSPPTPAATWRRKRRRVAVLLTTAFCCLPSVAGFGFSGVGALSPTTRTVVADAALVRAGPLSKEWRKRRAHEITCRVSSPRRYGSAVSGCLFYCVALVSRDNPLALFSLDSALSATDCRYLCLLSDLLAAEKQPALHLSL